MALYEPLFEGAIDIVGDIHGEYEALHQLLEVLGYDHKGNHAEGRRLVFLGDLVDRGPDSPKVLDCVIKMVEAGNAQAILGNHELNILLERPMHGNGWMIQPNHKERADEFHCASVDPEKYDRYMQFFAAMPAVLENDALRIVHACWNTQAVDQLKAHGDESTVSVYQHYQAQYQAVLDKPDFAECLEREKTEYYHELRNPDVPAPLLPAIAEKEYLKQMMNPIRILTTSSMQATDQPFFGGGKWRMAEREAWWESYTEDKPVIIGHFWRQYSSIVKRVSGLFGRDLFEGIESHAWMGAKHNVYCVDYSVGQRHVERRKQQEAEALNEKYIGKLAALRMPERQVIHDDGSVVDTY